MAPVKKFQQVDKGKEVVVADSEEDATKMVSELVEGAPAATSSASIAEELMEIRKEQAHNRKVQSQLLSALSELSSRFDELFKNKSGDNNRSVVNPFVDAASVEVRNEGECNLIDEMPHFRRSEIPSEVRRNGGKNPQRSTDRMEPESSSGGSRGFQRNPQDEDYLRVAKMTFPKYDGSKDLVPWFSRCENFFRLHKTILDRHSCGSTVSGSGLSTRWFLGYTCCDACGRLFVKGKYCPVCLKVYRDSESTPMVCCDACHHWVHCDCDGISDEKYQQYQTDGNLFYKCAACRGDCYKVRDGNDAVQELWRRRDKADRDVIASLRAAAGLPSQEDVFSVSPYSDDDDTGPIIYKNENGLKLSVKGFGENASKSKEYGKKASKSPHSKKKNAKKKGYHTGRMDKVEEGRQNSESIQETQSLNNSLADEDGLKHERFEVGSVPSKKEKAYRSHLGVQNSKSSEVGVRKEDKQAPVVQIKSSSSGEHFSKSENIKGTKLVIHLGSRNKNTTSSPISGASTGEREHDFTASNGSEEASRHLANDKKHEVNQGISKSHHSRGVKLGRENLKISSKGSGLIRLGKNTAEVPELNSKSRKSNILGDDSSEQAVYREAGAVVGNDEAAFKKSEGTATMHHGESWGSPSKFASTPKDPKPLLKLKFKNPNLDNSTWAPKGQEEKNSVKGQRSKRKRPTSLEERTLAKDDESGPSQQKNLMDEAMDVNWKLKNLGKDAIGKRVEIQQADNSWHKGLITNMVGDASLTIDFDDGRTKTLQLGKQGIRFISQKQKRSKTVIL